MTTREEVRRRDNGQCRICGTTESVHQHHIRFRSAQGSDEANNLVTLCFRCHEDVHNHTVEITVVTSPTFEIFTRRRENQ